MSHVSPRRLRALCVKETRQILRDPQHAYTRMLLSSLPRLPEPKETL